eukprot:CAMPEP_0184543302 /NCGR_PEP_ID=MMETSP0199_2-20130426/2833_1 /TAXON_ID=1112570 /ORGANISM="Thraustochytrium sp., Strain LLF1b" /LENGTH=64 /DNA_ID=CAMNT_0026937317 /DNA_START=68 /DNA_END=258 /DNA_ORIENTATION=-
MSDDVLAVGAKNADDKGSVYIFTLHDNGKTWSQTQKLVAQDGGAFDNFGNSVTMSNGVLAVGAA